MSIREETLYRNSFHPENFFLDYSKYNQFRKVKIKTLQDIINTHYYVEIFSSRLINWTFQVRSYRTCNAKCWYNYLLKCPICNQNIFRFHNKEGICKLNHRVQIYNLIPKFLKILNIEKIEYEKK